ncbi:MAG: CNNM domain-containing protein [Phycisphaerales bacterium]
MTLETIAWIAISAVSIVVSAIICGVEIGCYSLSRVRLELRVARNPPDRSARTLKRELDHPGLLLATLLIGNNIVQYVSSLATTNALHATKLSENAVALVNVAVLAPVMFVFAEALPKEYFRVEADRLTYTFARPLAAARLLLTWVGVLPLVKLAVRAIERAAGLQAEAVTDARQRIADHLKESVSAGVMSESQTTLVDRAMRFSALQVAEEMTPWALVRPIPYSADRAGALRIIGEGSHARFPVVDRYGRVVGVLRQIDLHLRPDAKVADLTTNCVRLKPDHSLREAILKMREAATRFGVVEDPQGLPLGIVTSKDLVEPLTGELVDY